VTSLAPGVPIRPAGHDSTMSEADPTGYNDSPDTTDDAAAPPEQERGAGSDTTLTTDDDAQQDDGVVRPGNEPD
jgi:hypothetical protein